jgi:hypothetical protein
VAVEHPTGDAPDVVVVIPGELRPGPDELRTKERHPREAQVVRVHEDVLHEHVGRARVLKRNGTSDKSRRESPNNYVQESSDVARVLRVHDVGLLLAEEAPHRCVPRLAVLQVRPGLRVEAQHLFRVCDRSRVGRADRGLNTFTHRLRRPK